MLAEELTGQSVTHLCELGKNTLIHKDAVTDFCGLQQAAKDAGFNLQIASGFRSFERQLQIWNNKYSGKTTILDHHEQPIDPAQISQLQKLYAILHWSALPGASRHHWGSDFDIYDPLLLPREKKLQLTVQEYCNDGYFAELSQWLTENMRDFGFFRPYNSFQGGVAVEPWHISYFPVAEAALKKLEQDLIQDLIIRKNVLGKSLISQQLPIIYKKFICNINPL